LSGCRSLAAKLIHLPGELAGVEKLRRQHLNVIQELGRQGRSCGEGESRRRANGNSRLSGAYSEQTGHAAKSGSFAYAMTGSVS